MSVNAASRRGGTAHCRALLYSFFAQSLARPDEILLQEISDGSLHAALDGAIAGLPPLHRSACAGEVRAALDAGAGAVAGDRDLLLVEYTRLFGNAVVCPHYEADHVSQDPFRGVQVLAAVSGFYEAFGVQVATAAGERPDYIGVELEFMNFLASKQALAAVRADRSRARYCREAQRRFLGAHLGVWAGDFCDQLTALARTPFHRAVAAALKAYLAAETRHLGA